ncbi:MAG: ATP-dependent dethiobiotin synthetase BioD, partial [Cytophagaceae bacterium]
GGLMVPLNDHYLVVDLIHQLGAEVVLVSQNYLGSINHTLLSVDVCRSRNIPLLGILFNGPTVPASETFILNYTGLPCLGRIGQEEHLTPETIQKYARLIGQNFSENDLSEF